MTETFKKLIVEDLQKATTLEEVKELLIRVVQVLPTGKPVTGKEVLLQLCDLIRNEGNKKKITV